MKTIQNLFHFSSGNCSGSYRLEAQPQIRSDFMRKELSAIGLAMVLSGFAVVSSLAADPATVTLRGHVPAVVARGKAQALGQVAPDTMINLSIGLPVRNRETLDHLVQQVSDPSSSEYGHFLTPAEFTKRFGPTEQQYQAVIDFARKSGLTITQTYPNRVLLSVRGNAADIENAFAVTLNRYRHPTEAREFFAPDREPTVNSALAILRIEGLENFSVPHPAARKLNQEQVAKLQSSGKAIGSGPGGSYQGSDFRNAYIPGSPLTGNGQNVGLVQFDGFFQSDIAAYEALIGLANPPNIVVVPVDGGVPAPDPFDAEPSLDIEMVLSMSPGVGTIYVYEGGGIYTDVLNRMANDNLAKNLSTSWFVIDGPPDPVGEQIFQQMAVQGQTFFAASGDVDAYLSGELIPFPSDSPHVTLAGGTTLTTGASSVYGSETVWNWDIEFGSNFDGVGSSGGISTTYTIPFWQTNINFGPVNGSSILRNVPDVALTGDNVLVLYGGGNQGVFGGTSCAAPLWAGFTALVNQQGALNGHPPVGFINPAIYQIAANAPVYANAFHDIVTGANTWSLSPNQFLAAPNYDLCTGLGSPNGTNFINAILAQSAPPPHISPPSAPYGTNMSSVAGGNPNGTWSLFMQDDTPLNSGYVSNGWVLSLTVADIVGTAGDVQVLISPTNGTVFPGQPVTFTLTVTNYGPSTSTNITVGDSLPAGVVLVSSNATQGTVSRSGSTLVWNVGTLGVNAGAGLVVTVEDNTVGSLVDSATVQTGTPDPNPDDDSAAAVITVVNPSIALSPKLVSGSLQISVPSLGIPGVSVVIQANTNLASTNWVNIYTGTPPFTFTDPAASGYVTRFYRAQIIP